MSFSLQILRINPIRITAQINENSLNLIHNNKINIIEIPDLDDKNLQILKEESILNNNDNLIFYQEQLHRLQQLFKLSFINSKPKFQWQEQLFYRIKLTRVVNNIHIVIPNDCRIGQEGAIDLSTIIDFLRHIRKFSLDLGQNQIGAQGFQRICQSVSKMAQLTSLHLNENSWVTLKNTLQIQKQLISLSLDIWENIGVGGSISLGKGLSFLINLKYLSLKIQGENNIQDDGSIHIGQGIGSLHQLTHLLIWIGQMNEIQEKGAQEIAEGIKGRKNLTTLKLVIERELVFQGFVALVNSTTYLTKLTSLYLKFCNVNGLRAMNDQILEIQKNQGFLNLINLRQLHIHIGLDSDFDVIGKSGFFNGFESLQSLESLHIELGKLGSLDQQACNSLQNSLMALTSLIELQLNIKLEQSHSFDHLMEGISFLRNLKYLIIQINISYNNFNLDQLIFQNTFRNLKQITILEFSFFFNEYMNDQIQQDLFAGISFLTNLKILKLEIQLIDLQSDEHVYFASALVHLTKLATLDIHFVNYINDSTYNSEKAEYVFQNLSKLSFLYYVKFRNVNLPKTVIVKQIYRKIKRLVTLG